MRKGEGGGRGEGGGGQEKHERGSYGDGAFSWLLSLTGVEWGKSLKTESSMYAKGKGAVVPSDSQAREK